MLSKLIVGFFVLFSVASPAVCNDTKNFDLARPKAALGVDLMKALQERKSVRSLSDKQVPLDVIGTILWSGYGVNRPNGKRTVPTARGRDVIDLYVVFDTAAYRYDPAKHALIHVADGDMRDLLATADWTARSPFLVVIVGKPAGRQGDTETGYIHFTAGAASQDMYLTAGSFGIGTVVMGMIKKDEITRTLELQSGQMPLYVMPFGYRK